MSTEYHHPDDKALMDLQAGEIKIIKPDEPPFLVELDELERAAEPFFFDMKFIFPYQHHLNDVEGHILGIQYDGVTIAKFQQVHGGFFRLAWTNDQRQEDIPWEVHGLCVGCVISFDQLLFAVKWASFANKLKYKRGTRFLSDGDVKNQLNNPEKGLTPPTESGKINGVKGENMCLVNPLQNDVQTVVNEFVSQGKSFTAFDVTVEVGNRVGMKVPHRYVKPEVVNALETLPTGYDVRIRTDINGQPREWYKTQPAAVATPATAAVKAPVASTNVGVAKNEDGTRLRVFRDALESVGFKPGEKVRAVFSPSMKAVFVIPTTSVFSTNDPDKKDAEYSVDVRQNLRLQLSTLGIPSASQVSGVSKVQDKVLQISLQ